MVRYMFVNTYRKKDRLGEVEHRIRLEKCCKLGPATLPVYWTTSLSR